jgi:hypothetical protein
MEAVMKAPQSSKSEPHVSKTKVSEPSSSEGSSAATRGSKGPVLPGPSVPGFSADEAKELLGMCVVANYLGPVVFAPFPIGLRSSADPENPLPNDDGRTYPYPADRIWPVGWGPAVEANDPASPWASSILTSRLANGAPVNGAIVSYNSARGVYAIAFAGTLNTGAAMQDEAALLVPAGPVNLGYFNSNESYLTQFPGSAHLPSGGATDNPPTQPPRQSAMVHLGYRTAVESMAVDPLMPLNLRTILSKIFEADPINPIELYVTGHSLGAAVAQLFSAWVRAGGVPSTKIHVKCYSFATPKSCNTPMAANYALALGNDGFSYRVENSLDTAPQLPPTKTVTSDLINPAIAGDLSSKAEPTGLYASSPLAPLVQQILASSAPGSSAPGSSAPGSSAPQGPASLPLPISLFAAVIGGLSAATSQNTPAVSMDYVGMGVPHVLAAQYPVVYDGRFYPPYLFPGRDPKEPVLIPDETTRQWWQHWPFNYARYLAADKM